MTKNILKITLILFSLIFNVNLAKADEAAQRVIHYSVEKPASTSQSIDIFENSLAKIDTILHKNKIDDYDLEEIHEISYSLENSINFLKENKDLRNQKIISRTATYVEKLHLTSENHNLAKTKIWFNKTKKSFQFFQKAQG